MTMATPRRKACVECRQQKIRCDVEQEKTPHDPCSRCRRMGLECRILPTSTRNLRQTKAEMRRELEELRWNMRHPNDTHHPPPTSAISADMHLASPSEAASFSASAASAGSNQSTSPYYEGGPSDPPSRKTSHSHTQTLPRALDGHVIDAKRVEECYTLFFTQYHPLLPILDPSLSANDFYDLSPFLFWCVIVTGSRRYNDDPTILDRLSQLITPLAFSSMALRSTPIPVIQGLLILCTWRLPTNSMYKDMTHVLCGAAVHLATQIGLHIAGVGQDFARLPLEKNLEEKVFRAKLWMYCVIVSIRSSCAEGIPPLTIAESFFDGDEKERDEILNYIPQELLFLHKVHIILLRAMSAMVRTNIRSTHCDAGTLRSLISIFDSQLLDLTSSSPNEFATFQSNFARIHILAYHFFAHPSTMDMESLSRLYSLCVLTIQAANHFAQTANLYNICPSFIDRTLCLTGFAILKISRSPLAQHLDLAAGERAYFSAIQFSKNNSLQNNDLGARAAAIMTQLWGSNKVFKRRDGRVDSLGLGLRTRLSMSVSFDMFWYWRAEFGNMSNPYNNGEESGAMSNTQTQSATPQTDQKFNNAPLQLPTPAITNPTNESLDQVQQPLPATMDFDALGGPDYNLPPSLDQFPDYDWAASFDFSNEWPSGPLGIPPEPTGAQGYGFN